MRVSVPVVFEGYLRVYVDADTREEAFTEAEKLLENMDEVEILNEASVDFDTLEADKEGALRDVDYNLVME